MLERLKSALMRSLALGAITLLLTCHAAVACYEDGDAPVLTGVLSLVQPATAAASELATVAPEPYYTLELEKPVCIKGEHSNRVAQGVRSVQVFVVERAREAAMQPKIGKRVSVTFLMVFEAYNSLHRRPMLGSIKTIRLAS